MGISAHPQEILADAPHPGAADLWLPDRYDIWIGHCTLYLYDFLMASYILGISAYYHDSAAVLLCDDRIIAAAHEERFTRLKHDARFPRHAIAYVLEEGGISMGEIDAVAFYDKPFLKFERLLETYHAMAPQGLSSFLKGVPVWIREKLFMKQILRRELHTFGLARVPLLFPEHHLSHAASAFYPSPFEEAAILTVDGVGEWATASIGHGKGKEITLLRELHFPHSVGMLYSAFTYYLGFRVNSGEYKLMGLAPYGHHDSERTRIYKEKIIRELVDIREDGSILLNMKYFRFATGLRMTDDRRWAQLFGIARKQEHEALQQEHMDLALAIQEVTEDILFRMARTARALTQARHLVMAGGVALNSVASGKLLLSGMFDDIWIQPAAGDAGGALGAAYLGQHIWKGMDRKPDQEGNAMQGAYLGPAFKEKDIRSVIRRYQAQANLFEDESTLMSLVAKELDEGKVVGWFQGRMEFGPRALGNRSILGDPRSPAMQKHMNVKIKFREGFRPFAPAVLDEDKQEYFHIERPSPYMLLVVPVNQKRIHPLPDGYQNKPLYERLYFKRSDIPAITHIDYSARLQSVHRETNPRFWSLIRHFKERTGYGLLINTSFNVRGEPIVCTPDDAFRCFMRTDMDILVMENFVFRKEDQEPRLKTMFQHETFKPD